jgi:hypothetical protein
MFEYRVVHAKALREAARRGVGVPSVCSAAVPYAGYAHCDANTRATGASLHPRGGVAFHDLWAIRVREDAWVHVYVWQVVRTAGRAYARVEFVGHVHARPPTATTSTFEVQPRYDGRWQYWAHSIDKATGTSLLATGVTPPFATQEDPKRVPRGGAKDLPGLARACYRALDT